MDHAKLFNCMPGHKAPDWSLFDALEVQGCCNVADGMNDDPNGPTYTESGYGRDEADLFTVYGHLKEGGTEAITDCRTYREALDVARELATLSGGLTISVFV